MSKKEYWLKVSEILSAESRLEDATVKLYWLVRDYAIQYNLSSKNALNELGIISFEPLFEDLEKTIIRKEKIKRILE